MSTGAVTAGSTTTFRPADEASVREGVGRRHRLQVERHALGERVLGRARHGLGDRALRRDGRRQSSDDCARHQCPKSGLHWRSPSPSISTMPKPSGGRSSLRSGPRIDVDPSGHVRTRTPSVSDPDTTDSAGAGTIGARGHQRTAADSASTPAVAASGGPGAPRRVAARWPPQPAPPRRPAEPPPARRRSSRGPAGRCSSGCCGAMPFLEQRGQPGARPVHAHLDRGNRDAKNRRRLRHAHFADRDEQNRLAVAAARASRAPRGRAPPRRERSRVTRATGDRPGNPPPARSGPTGAGARPRVPAAAGRRRRRTPPPIRALLRSASSGPGRSGSPGRSPRQGWRRRGAPPGTGAPAAPVR